MKIPPKIDFVCFHFGVKQPEVNMLDPQRDHCVSEFVLHGTVLITNFSVHPHPPKNDF